MPSSQNGQTIVPNLNWAPILGLWEFGESEQLFKGQGLPGFAHGQSFPMGLAVSNAQLQNGRCRVRIRFSRPFGEEQQAAGIVIGYRSPQNHYVFAELGAARSAFSIGEFVDGSWRPLVTAGALDNLRHGRIYVVELRFQGQELRVTFDDVPVIHHLLTRPLEGSQVGLIAAGSGEITFSEFEATGGRPRVFVAMQFTEPFDTLYKRVIKEQVEAAGFDPIRIDEKPGPGVIFQDIQREIEQAAVVVAEVTPTNVNVFYELGYAHALGKPTILLARRDSPLPFDIRSIRVVYYDDTIGGKPDVEQSLRKHLDAIADR